MTTATIRTWGEALDYTWRVKWKRLASATTNKINANHITEHAGRSMPLSRMAKAGWWLELIADMEDAGRSSSTINRIISAGTTVLKFTKLAGLHNVECPTFQRLKEGEHRLTYFTKDQVEQMAHAAIDVFDRQDIADVIVFAAYTGMRQGEILRIRAEDIDLNLGCIWVGGKPSQVTKGKNVRSLPIHEKVEPILNKRLSEKPKGKLFGDDFAHKDALYRSFKKVRDYCGITQDHVFHSLRHSFGTFLGEVCHPRTIMALMGHADVTTSLRYVKATDDATRKAIGSI